MVRRIAEDFGSSVHVYSGGEPMVLGPGDEVPDDVELGEHIKTTGRRGGSSSADSAATSTTSTSTSTSSSGGGGESGPGGYDPGQHSVDDVNAYLKEHPDQAEQVLAAERAGKARKGILAGD